jgi:sulfopyruvate decarboxylase alpha subunit
MTTGTEPTETAWAAPAHQALVDAGITMVGYVPDGGLRDLIVRLDADPRVKTVRLTTEEEGVALCAGAWLGGSRAALLMQSSGVGNCINMLSLLASCRLPAFHLVTMRGQDGESNPWQVPMGSAAGEAMALMGVDVRRADSSDGVAPAITRACIDTFDHGGPPTAVLIDQSVIGVKRLSGDDE